MADEVSKSGESTNNSDSMNDKANPVVRDEAKDEPEIAQPADELENGAFEDFERANWDEDRVEREQVNWIDEGDSIVDDTDAFAMQIREEAKLHEATKKAASN